MDLWTSCVSDKRRHGHRAAPVSIFAKDLSNVEVFQVEKQTKQIAAGSGMAWCWSGSAVGRQGVRRREIWEEQRGKGRMGQRRALEQEAKQLGL